MQFSSLLKKNFLKMHSSCKNLRLVAWLGAFKARPMCVINKKKTGEKQILLKKMHQLWLSTLRNWDYFSLTFSLNIDHKGFLVYRLPATNHLIYGITSVIGHVCDIDSQYWSWIIVKWLVFMPMKNLKWKLFKIIKLKLLDKILMFMQNSLYLWFPVVQMQLEK